jgi:hypothetical protein
MSDDCRKPGDHLGKGWGQYPIRLRSTWRAANTVFEGEKTPSTALHVVWKESEYAESIVA